MTSLTETARQRLEQYIHQIRTYLGGCEGIDADEVERDVRDHIEHDLETEAAPVSEETLSGVLRRLGSPWQWIPRDEQPWWRRCAMALRSGPEDYRLAYISLGLFIIGIVEWGRHLLPPIVFFLGGFLAARSVLAFDPEPDEIRRKRWLIYPSLILIYALVLGLFLIWPAGLVGSFFDGFEQQSVLDQLRGAWFDSDTVLWMLFWLIGAAAVGIWWIVAGGLMMKFSRVRRSFFRPFLESGRLAVVIIAVGASAAVLGGIGAAVLYHYAAVSR